MSEIATVTILQRSATIFVETDVHKHLEMMDQARIHTMDDDFNGNCGNKCVKV
jgi:hypothetical protein